MSKTDQIRNALEAWARKSNKQWILFECLAALVRPYSSTTPMLTSKALEKSSRDALKDMIDRLGAMPDLDQLKRVQLAPGVHMLLFPDTLEAGLVVAASDEEKMAKCASRALEAAQEGSKWGVAAIGPVAYERIARGERVEPDTRAYYEWIAKQLGQGGEYWPNCQIYIASEDAVKVFREELPLALNAAKGELDLRIHALGTIQTDWTAASRAQIQEHVKDCLLNPGKSVAVSLPATAFSPMSSPSSVERKHSELHIFTARQKSDPDKFVTVYAKDEDAAMDAAKQLGPFRKHRVMVEQMEGFVAKQADNGAWVILSATA